jgi:malate dehydrogenase
MPIRSNGSTWEVVQGLEISEFAQSKIDASNAELLSERETVEGLGIL